jgi:hypothetical protein
MLRNLAGKNPSNPNLPNAWSPSEREWFSLPRSANNYSLKHNVYTFGSIGNFFTFDGGGTALGDDGFTGDHGNEIDYTQSGAAAQVGRSLNPSIFNWIPVAYNTTAYPIATALQTTVDRTIDMILGSTGKVFLVGNGFGAVVTSMLYKQFLSGGKLNSRTSDLLGVYNFGSPMRQAGHTIPSGIDPGGFGAAPASQRLTSTGSLVWEFANPLDPISVVNTYVAPVVVPQVIEISEIPGGELVRATATAGLRGGKITIGAELGVTAIPTSQNFISATATTTGSN